MAAIASPEVVPPGSIARRRTFRNRWYRTPAFVAGATILILLIAASIGAPLIARYDPNAQDLLHTYAHPSGAHWLGTDELGRDVLSRLIYAGRVDLLTAFFAVFFPFCIGTAIGCVAGYYGRFADTVLMRLVDVMVAFPFLVLVLALVFVLGPGQRSIIIAITAVGWVSYARIVRGEILVQKRLEYVLAARAAGLSDARIIVRHLLPNVITQAIVFSMSDIVLSVLAIVTLSYLGAGIPPPTADWGSMIADGESLITTQWQIATFPGIAILITGLGLSLLGDGLADLLAPE
ncbi:MAG TPA: ABC transporter permease [Gaiellales bacterium]|jgi:peptide/nickel transport system permease protein|nr:ABC transporter permease [Gaiellales bacterium]